MVNGRPSEVHIAIPREAGQNAVYRTPEKCIETLRTIAETMDAAKFVGFFKYAGCRSRWRSAA